MASGQQYQVTLPGPAPWGFRLSGGKDFSSPLSISRVTPGGRASMANIAPGDVVLRIGSRAAETLTHIEAQNIIKTNDGQLELTLVRGDGRARPMPATPAGPSAPTISAQPVQASAPATQAPPMRIQRPTVYKPPPLQQPSAPSPPLRAGQPFSPKRVSPVQPGTTVQTGPSHLKVSSVSAPMTRISPTAPTRLSSLSTTSQPPSTGAPRSPTSPGMVHSQYNTPINMYAVENVTETLKGQQLLQEAQNSVDVGAIKRAGEAGLGKPAAPIEIEAGGRKIVHAQYDTPLGMYSTGAVQDTLEGQLAGLVGGKPEVTAPQRPADQPASKPGTVDTSSAVYQMIQEESARKARMQPRVAPPPEPPTKPGASHAQSRSFRLLQMMTAEDEAELAEAQAALSQKDRSGPQELQAVTAKEMEKAVACQSCDGDISAPAAPTATTAPSGVGRPADQRRRVVRGDRQDRKAKPIVYAKMGAAGSRTPLCDSCNQIIRGPFVVAIGRCWMPDCFTCAHCKCNLIEMGFVEEEGQLYCSTHYKEFFAPLCGKCNEPIAETSRKLHGSNVHVTVKAESIIANDLQFHKHCFLCAKCSCQLDPNGYHLWEGAQICDICFSKTMSTKCIGCDFPIEPGDRWLEALNCAWHTECFCCAVCQADLEGQPFYAKGKKPFCKNHKKQAI
ncbi:PDZ and LIM domain protein 7-like isoform X12 [Branchiostoma floridae]|uniref:PDZ and LIM domain protein 7-like isoform X12 n=1 Tax=Branchiostoma floridae TaxID=7739 RepID=A0A9J7KVU9_BRAFL|nr:PDZ and LIM domain protein 7-like isoform X12 [Branchiostoma floridae]